MKESIPDQLYFTTAEAARQINVPEHELRYWEKIGLLVPMKISSGHRRYRRVDITKGLLIKDLLAQGYAAKGLKNVLSKRKKNVSKFNTAGELLKSVKREEMLNAMKKEVQEIMDLLKNF